ncbi:MAG: S8 family serine peptidase [Candidatus Delongbacteria bacterium]|jgi:serine protease|nr:S8 family serine peptidase [Candidatus Delongbacteria bacterium]
MKLLKLQVIIAFALLTLSVLSYAETITLNNREYEKINDQWYQIEGSDQYLVNTSVITVKFNPDISESQINTKLTELGCTALRTNILGYMDIEIPSGVDPLEIVQEYIGTSIVDVAEPNTIGEYIAESDDPLFSNQWYLGSEASSYGIDAVNAWDIETGNPNVLVAVLDSGSDILHEDLENNIWVNPGEDLDGDGVVWDMDDINGIDDDGNGYVDDITGWDFGSNNNDVTGSFYHGTHVAGIAGATTNNKKGVAGVAGGWNSDKGCGMMIGGVGDSSPNGAILDDAILYAAMKGAKVITMSLTVAPSTAIDDAIAVARNNYNCFIDCASGNGYSSSISYPSSNPNVVAVGGTDGGSRASFSNYGDGLMVVAPGVDIWSSRIGNTYGTGGGTSYAAPQVAAVAGLVASRYPEFTNKDIEKVICLTAMKLPYDFNQIKEYGTWNNEVGYGKLNADRALGYTGIVDKSKELVEGNYFYGTDVNISNSASLTCDLDSRTYLFENSRYCQENCV